MGKFIKLTVWLNRMLGISVSRPETLEYVYINKNIKIVAMERYSGHTNIITSDTNYDVIETPEEIIKLINKKE